MLVHFADDLFGKQAGLSGNADQDIRLNVADHIEQRQHIFLGIPMLEIFAFCTSLVWKESRFGILSVNRPKRSTMNTR